METQIKDVSSIQDEDVLRRMWQQTEDFGRKKEIRTHMYKLREARLKEFYSSGEVLRDVQRSNSSPGLRDQQHSKQIEGPTHADSLADHSFLSLKSKEIRDSESPTREVQYRNSKNRSDDDGTWTCTSKTEKSQDGKTITNTRTASTQGSRPLDGGQVQYAAAAEQQSSIYADGDANNFTKRVGETSKSFAQQDVTVGDDQNYRSSKTTSSTSSSKVVSHQSSTSGHIDIDQSLANKAIDDGHSSAIVEKNIYTTSVPDKLNKDLIDGNTKVITETKTLPDGSTVTTTRYETKGSKKWSSNNQSSTTTTNRQVVEQKSSSSTIDNKKIKYISGQDGDNVQKSVITTKIVRDTTDDGIVNRTLDNVNQNGNVRIIQSEKNVYDNVKADSQKQISKTQRNIENIRNVEDQVCQVTRKTEDIRERNVTEKDHKVMQDDKNVKVIKTVTRTEEDYFQPSEKKPVSDEIHTTVQSKTTVNVKSNVTQKTDAKKIADVKRKQDVSETCKIEPHKEPIKPQKIEHTYPENERPIKVQKPESEPQKIERTKLIKPQEEPYKPSEPTDGQYSTTYRSEFTNKRISVDISPSHNAFASSLRAISPDRSSDRPKSRGSVSSLRSSTSPDKYQPSRMSPDRKPSSDNKRTSPTKQFSPEQDRKQSRPTSPEKSISPTRSYSPERDRYIKQSVTDRKHSQPTSPGKTIERITTTTVTTKTSKQDRPYDSDTLTKTKPSNLKKSPERRTPSPTKSTDRSSPIKSTVTSKTSITTSRQTSPEKTPSRGSSPTKTIDRTSPSKSTKNEINSDTITRKKKIISSDDTTAYHTSTDIVENISRTGTITKKKNVINTDITEDQICQAKKPSKDLSPTSSTSDFEFVNHNQHLVTDLDEPETRPTSLEIEVTVKKTKQVTDKSSPTKEHPRQKSPTKITSSPVKEVPKLNMSKQKTPQLDSPSDAPPKYFPCEDDKLKQKVPTESKEKPPLKRTETYEERCRKMLGLSDSSIQKKEYVPDEYADRQPVEEPLFIKKHIDYSCPDGPQDKLIHANIEQINKRRPEFSEDDIIPKEITDKFIKTEKEDTIVKKNKTTLEKTTPDRKRSSPDRKSPEKQPKRSKEEGEYTTEYTDEYHKKKTSPGRKSPEKQFQEIPKTEGEYTTEYTDEYFKKQTNLQRKSPERKPELKPKEDGEYTSEYTDEYYKKQTLPGRKSPEKQLYDRSIEEGEYVTEYNDEYYKKQTTTGKKIPEKLPKDKQTSSERKLPEKQPFSKKLPDKSAPITTTTSITKKTGRESPEKSPQQKTKDKIQPKSNLKTRDDKDYTTEYVDEYCSTTEAIGNEKVTKIPSDQKPSKEILLPAGRIEKSPTRKPKETKPKTKKFNDDKTDSEEDSDEYYEIETEIKTNKITNRKTENRKSPVKEIPKYSSPTRELSNKPTIITDLTDEHYITKNITVDDIKKTNKTTDFIQKEKHDTDITLISSKKKTTELEDNEFDLDNETVQESHIRTHRIDTTIKSSDTSPKRHPQKAVPSDTIECTFKKTNTTKDISEIDKKVTQKFNSKVTTTDSIKKFSKPEEKSPIKPKDKKDLPSKSPSQTKLVTNITTTSTKVTNKKTETESKRKPEESPRKKSPERVTKKPSNKYLPIKQISDVKEKLERKKTDKPHFKSSPATSPERKPFSKPITTTITTTKSPKETIQQKTDTVKKHTVTKTISLTSPDAKPQVSINKSPRTITTIKTTKITQPSSITVTTAKTTKSSKKQTKSKDIESSDSESESELIENIKTGKITHKKRVITTANIKITSPKSPTKVQGPNKTRPEVTMPTFKVNGFATETILTSSEANSTEPIITCLPSPTKKDKLTTKCITTKSIILNNQEVSLDDLEITIDLQRSTSSREPSPDKICPVPVSSEDESGYPRYPDQVSEPDDVPKRKKPTKIRDIPLTEEEDVKNFHRITEVNETTTSRKPATKITDIDKVNETDESLLSVTEKVSKFITTTEKLSHDNRPKLKKPAPKVPRPEFIVDENLENDECLLSVSDKVNKFISTAEQISIATTESDRPRSPIKKTQTPYDKSKVDQNDECLMSVTEKVTHFIQAAETSKSKPTSLKEGPTPKVTRPEFTNIDETLKSDECLLSVSDKVSKFLTTADKLTTTDTKSKTETIFTKREPSPEKTRFGTPNLIHSPSRKSPEQTRKSPESTRKSPESTRKSPEPTRKSPDKTTSKIDSTKVVETKQVNLKSSEAVRKAKAMFENISKQPQDIPKQKDILSRPSIWEGRKKTTTENDVKLTDIGVYHKQDARKQLMYDSDEETCKRTTNTKDVTLKSTKLILNDTKLNKLTTTDQTRYKSPEREMPGYMKPLSKHGHDDFTTEKKTFQKIQQIETEHDISDYSTLIPRATDNQDMPGYMRPIPKVSQEERDKYVIEIRSRNNVSPERDTPMNKPVHSEQTETHKITTKHTENGDIPHYMKPLQRCLSPEREYHRKSIHDEEEIVIETTIAKSKQTADNDLPGYMRPLQRKTHSPERGVEKTRELSESPILTDDSPRAGKKFGVTLRRTDSGRMLPISTTERRRSSVPGQPIIEDIQDLDVLEKMMDKVVGYEQRRRIRTQIRLVRKLISENKITTTKKISKYTSPIREPIGLKDRDRQSPVKEITKRPISPSRKSKLDEKSTFDSKTKHHSTINREEKSSYSKHETMRKERSMSPDIKKKTSTSESIYNKTELKHVQPAATKTMNDEKPAWVTNRNLKKTVTEARSEERKTTSTTSASKKKEILTRRSPSPQKDIKPTDCITSSYGIGPTDENGLPLFGIRALRKAATGADKVHVRGTVVKSEFYSENGNEPVGSVSVTKYSSDPKELQGVDEEVKRSKGFAAVTTTRNYGSRTTRDSPTRFHDQQITDKDFDEDELLKTTSTSTSNKVTTRRGSGSVKALSQKFISNESSRNDRQTYPKAGLILRTSSFKDTTTTTTSSTQRKSSSRECSRSRESSPGYESRPGRISLSSLDARRSSDEKKTFLNSHTRVTNAQDVITRMKNAEKEEHDGDTAEDREARMLLNKFLGAQVILSGMEPLLGRESASTTTSTSTSSAQLVRKVQKTKTVTSSNKKDSSKNTISLNKRFQCPITIELLQDIWDEQTLRSLLEQCTDYEERRLIRARLRQVMAEQEAVANVVANAVAERDTDRTSIQGCVETSKKTVTAGPITTTQMSTRVIQSSRQVNKPISPFAKFRQLDKQNSLNTPPSSPRTPGAGGGAPLFKFTDPALSHSASTIKDRLLHWCQMKTKEYQNIKLENFSTSWADGLAFCALIHHFLPDAFDYHALTPQQRRHNFTLAFKVADEQADIAPLLDVDDMVAMRRPDWKCVFTYVQSIYRRFKDED